MFSEEDLQNRIAAANEQFVSGEEVLNAPPDPNAKPVEAAQIGTGKEVPVWTPVDLYNRDTVRRYDESKKTRPKGSPAVVKAAVKAIVEGEGGLARKYKVASGDSDYMLSIGDKKRASLVQKQYMEDSFWPAIEAIIDYSSPDELLNCREALSELDKYALGLGSMSGYTAAYVAQAYGDQLGQKEGKSDPSIIDTVRRIRILAESDDVRTAIGLAVKAKKQIERGEHIASDDDYELIRRVSSYAN